MTDIFRRLGQRTAQTSLPRQGTRTGDLAAALADTLAPQAPARDLGQQAAPWAQAAIQPAVHAVRQLAQQVEDEPWVEVVNSQNEDDYLFMPASVASHAPSGWQVTGPVDSKDLDFIRSDQNTLSIYQQAPEVQAAWGIAMPGTPAQVGVSSGQSVAPMVAGQGLAGLARTANEQTPSDGGGWLSAILDSPVPGTDTSIGDLIDFTAQASTPAQSRPGPDTVSDTLTNRGFPMLPIPGTSGQVSVGQGADALNTVVNAVRNTQYIDPGAIIPALGTVGSEISDLGDGGWRNPGEVKDVIDAAFSGVGEIAPAITEPLFAAANALPQWWASAMQSAVMDGEINLEGPLSGRLNAIIDNVPGADQAITTLVQMAALGENNIDQIMQVIASLPVVGSPGALTPINVSGGRIQPPSETGPKPDFGQVWPLIRETIPTHYAAWIQQHPTEARSAYDEGGAEAVWEAYQADTAGGWIGAMQRLWRDMYNDPTAWAALVAPIGKVLQEGGIALRLDPAAGPASRVVGSIVEQTGTALERGGRLVENVGDMFVEPALGAAGRAIQSPLNRASDAVVAARAEGETPSLIARAGDKLNILRTSDAGMRAAQTDAFDRATAAMQRDVPQPITPDTGPDAGDSFDPDAPNAPDPNPPEPQVAEDLGRAERAQAQPEPSTDEIQVGEGVVYTPRVRIRRTDEGWQVETQPRTGAPEAGPAVDWQEALGEAETARVNLGESADTITMIPPRWVENVEGDRLIDSIMKQVTPQQRQAIRQQLAPEWIDSVERQAQMGRGTPTPDHALESSRIALRTAEAARAQNPNVGRPTYRPNEGQARRTPYHAMEDAIYLPWDQTVAQRAYLYGSRRANWKPKGGRPGRIEAPVISDKLGPNPTPAQVEAAGRYVDLVRQHEAWYPNEVGERWAEAQRKAAAIEANPNYAGRASETPEPPAQAQPQPQRQQPGDIYTDDRYPSEVISEGEGPYGDGTVTRYTIDEATHADVTTHARSQLPKVVIRRHRAHPRAGDPVWFSGEIYRDEAHVGSVEAQPDVHEVVDHLVRLADEGDNPFAAGTVPEPPQTPPAPESAPEPATAPENNSGNNLQPDSAIPENTPEPQAEPAPEPQAARQRSWVEVQDEVNKTVRFKRMRPGVKKDGYARRLTIMGDVPEASSLPEITVRPDEGVSGKPSVLDNAWTVTVGEGAVRTSTTFDNAQRTAQSEARRRIATMRHNGEAALPTAPEPQVAQAEPVLRTQEIPAEQPRQAPLVDETPQPRRRTQAAVRTEDAAPVGRTVTNAAEQPGARPVEAASDPPQSERISAEDRPRAGSIDPRALTLDPSLFQFRSTLDNPTGVNQVAVDRMVREWDPLQQDPVIVWERTPGELVVTSGHHRVTAARIRTERGIPTPVDYVIKDFDASDIQGIRTKARRSNKGKVAESPVDIAHQVRSLEAENPNLTDVQLAREVDRAVEDIAAYRNIGYLPPSLLREMNAGFNFKAGRFKNGFLFKQAAGAALGEQIRLGRIDGAAAQDFHARYAEAGLSTDEFVAKVNRNIGLMAEKVGTDEATAGTLFDVGDFGSARYAAIDAIDDQLIAEQRKLKTEQGTLRKANKLEDTTAAERTRNEKKIARRQKKIDALERKYQRAMDGVAREIKDAPPNPAPAEVVPASTREVPSVYDTVEQPPAPSNGQATEPKMPAKFRNMPEAVSGPDDPAVNRSLFDRGTEDVAYANVPVDLGKAIVGARYLRDGTRRMIERRRAAEAARPLPRTGRVAETTNTGTLFERSLGWQEEAFLTKNKLADGKPLLWHLESYKHQYMTGKSAMWDYQAEHAAVAKVREEWQARLKELYPGGSKTPPFLVKASDFLDAMMQYFRETVLWNHLRWVSYPATQWLGNSTNMAVMAGRPGWVLPYWKNAIGAVRQARFDARIADIEALNTKIAAFHASGKPGKVAQRANQARLEARSKAITNVLQRLDIEADGELRAAIEKDPNVLREVWMADPGLSASGRIHLAMKTRAGRELTNMYEGFLGDIDDPLIVQKVLGGAGERIAGAWGRRIGHNVGRLAGSKKIAKWGAHGDFAFRDTIWSKVFDGELARSLPDYRNSVIQRHMDWTGASKAEATAFWNQLWDALPDQYLNADHVRAHYQTVLEPGQADRLGRDWQAEVYKLEDRATSEVRRISFAGDETRADLFLRKVMVFHYFFTRQAYFFGHQALRHPVLLNIYADAQEELAQYAAANEDILPGWMQGWVAMLGVPAVGLNLFVNPATMFSTYLMFRAQSTFTPEGITGAGSLLDELDSLIGLNPFLMAGANILGYMGEGYAPDPFFLYNQTETLTRLWNFAQARGWVGDDARPSGNWWTDLWDGVRADLSGIAPGSTEIPATSSAAKYEREVKQVATDEAAKMGRPVVITAGMSDEQKAEVEANRIWFAEQMADPDSELYQRSVKRWTAGEVITSAATFVLGPFRPRTRQAATAADGAGEGPAGTSPDLAGQLATAEDAPWSIINAGSPEALRLQTQADGYYGIGTERQQQAAHSYTLIMTGTTHYAVTVGGTTYTPMQIHNMTDDQRKKLAQAYLQQQGYLDEWQDLQGKQDDFLAETGNADFAQYKSWQGEVYDYAGGPDAYWQDYLERNPDNAEARRYYESVLDANFLDTDRDKALAGMQGYMVTKGIRPGAYDANPDLSWFEVNDPVGVVNTPPKPTPKEEFVSEYDTAVREGVPEYATDMQVWDEAVTQKQAQMGLPDVPFNELPTKQRIAVEDALKEDDVFEPELPWQVRQYLEWVSTQPSGADTSIDAYLNWNEAQYEAGATERFEESLKPTLSDEEAVRLIDQLRTEHDYTYKK